ncbi:MAG TPA: 30S ribosome-binding factor RbfA [Candidatus Binatia bacterium]|nr:30S ribosome-binding factor RbfA [Candidatus Binatia bacterium]
MGERRPERVAHLVQAEIAGWLLRDAKDPRLQRVTVTGVRMSPDLRHARVFVRTLGGRDRAEALRALGGAGHALRGAVARALALRVTPELHFEWDATPDRAARVDALLRGDRPGDDEGSE